MICVVLALISGLVQLETLHGKVVQDQGPRTIVKCIGSSLTLNEPDPKITNLRAFRGDESLASTTAAATGRFRDRLIVDSDGRVTLENLSADDLGVYRVEIKLSRGRRIQRSLRLVVSEPPQTDHGTLSVNTISSNDSNSVRLTCSTFTSLGFPPVSAVWEDPLGHVLPSDGFKDQAFYLDLPLDTAEPGDYCCRMDCPAPTYCCLEERSPLRRCAQVHVQTRQARATVKRTNYVSEASFFQLQQQVLDIAAALRRLQDSDRQRPHSCPTEKGYSWHGRRCLKFNARTVNFQYARASCLADGAHLIKIKSVDDGPLLRDAVRAAGITVTSPIPTKFVSLWTGATAIEPEGTFLWSDGTVLPKFSPLWYSGEPNNDRGTEKCVHVLLDTTSMYLNDEDCTAQFVYFCEYE